jgi:hypothetical protein
LKIGLSGVGTDEQLSEFARSMRKAFNYPFNVPGTWFDAFDALAGALPRRGLAFEQVCLGHVGQIKRALGIAGVSANVFACRIPSGPNREPGAQIDLVIDRADGIVDLCEMKHTREAFAVSAEYRESSSPTISPPSERRGKAIEPSLPNKQSFCCLIW